MGFNSGFKGLNNNLRSHSQVITVEYILRARSKIGAQGPHSATLNKKVWFNLALRSFL